MADLPLRDKLLRDLQVRPIGIVNALRLYTAYLAALLGKLIVPWRFVSAGHMIPGKDLLTVSVGGIMAYVRPQTEDLVTLSGSGEPQTIKWFRVAPGDTVVDVGAHVGRYSLIAARSASRVIAMEPIHSSFSMLRENVKLNCFSHVTALNIAISDQHGSRNMYTNNKANAATSSLEKEWSRGIGRGEPRGALPVECDTLDNVLGRLRLTSLDWLKVDVEGHEVHVLRGAKLTLRTTRRLIIEVARGNERSCMNLLRIAGLRLVAVERMGHTSNWLLVRC